MLSSFLFDVADHRRSQGKRYELGHILMFSVLGIGQFCQIISQYLIIHKNPLRNIRPIIPIRLETKTSLHHDQKHYPRD